jgi:hypothetical protein
VGEGVLGGWLAGAGLGQGWLRAAWAAAGSEPGPC